ncbi:MAG: YfcE family phosphodiesterase [Candidatus Izimaplasma sp.]|nr:YfcE family phosphodiesterase [Candidatus Izimaplasma bacterium]
MKILIFSDSHQDKNAIKKMLNHEGKVDKIYCAGDSGLSIEELDELKIISVKGNYPFAPKLPNEKIIKIGTYKALVTHGHKYYVKFGLNRLFKKTLKIKVDMVIFGHTHQIHLEKTKKLIMLNPGALSYSRSHSYPSYARVFVEGSEIMIEIVNLLDFTIVKSIKKADDE